MILSDQISYIVNIAKYVDKAHSATLLEFEFEMVKRSESFQWLCILSDIMFLILWQHMRRYQMIRRGGSMTSLVLARHRGRAMEEEEANITSNSTTSRSTLMTFSKTLTTLASNSDTNITFTPTVKGTRRDTSTATSRPTRRLRTDTGGSFSRKRSAEESSMTYLRTWRRFSPSTHTIPGLRTDSRAQGSSTAGQ